MDRILQEFTDWLIETYGKSQAQAWVWTYTGPGVSDKVWKTNPVYQYWAKNVYPTTVQTNAVLRYIRFLDKLDELILNGQITENQVIEYGNEYQQADETRKLQLDYLEDPQGYLGAYLQTLGADEQVTGYLSGFTSTSDLADKINRLNVDQTVKANLYDAFTGAATKGTMAIRGAEGRTQAEQGKLQQDLVKQRQEYGETVAPALSEVFNNPLVTQADLNRYRDQPVDQMITNVTNRAQNRALGEEQAGRAYLSGLDNLDFTGVTKTWEGALPETTSSLLEQKRKQAGYATGSRLGSFLESQLGTIASDTAGARQKWYEDSMVTTYPTYEDEVNRLQSEAARWTSIAEGAPSSEYTSNTYWGPGGLKQMALDAAAYAESSLGNLKPGDYGQVEGGVKTEDPLVTELNKLTEKKLRAEYYRRPGTVNTSLSRALRF